MSAEDERVSGIGATALLARLSEFDAALRAAGYRTSPARLNDAARALDVVGLRDPRHFRWALRTSYSTSRDEEVLFDRLFDDFWLGDALNVEQRSDERLSQAEVPDAGDAAPLHPAPSPSWSLADRLEARDLSGGWALPDARLKRRIRALVRRLASRPGSSWKPSHGGPIPDLRRTARRWGARGEIAEILHRRRPKRRTRLRVLCDVSGSMEDSTPFLLRTMFLIQKVHPRARTAVFSSRASEVTGALRSRSIDEVLSAVAAQASHWGGGTNVAAGLSLLNRELIRAGDARSTVVLIVSDGYDRGRLEDVRAELARLRKRVGRIVWLNPIAAVDGYEPIARCMTLALPFIDDFVAATPETPPDRLIELLTTAHERKSA